MAVAMLLTACGGGGGQGTPATPNHPPVASVAAIQTVLKRAIVTLDGSPSSDPDRDPLTYQWTQTGGTTVVMTGATTAKPSFVAPAIGGTLTFALVVSDGKTISAPENASVLVQNRPPVASAVQSLTAYVSQACVLDGSASSDPDGDPVTCAWIQTGGPTVTLQSLGGTKASFTAPAVTTTLTFSMVSKDGENDSAHLAITVTVTAPSASTPPVASAGISRTVSRGSTVTLQGSASDADHDPLTYTWAQTAGTPVSLGSPTSAMTTFVAPTVDGDLTFSLIAHDASSDSAPATVVIRVADQAPTLPIVTLTPALPKRGDVIQAQASATDPDHDTLAYAYAWKRNGVLISGANTATYPLGNQAKGDVISVEVTATDGTLSTTGRAQVLIADTPPVADAGTSRTVTRGLTVALQGSGSDADLDSLTFTWSQTAGTPVSIVASTSATASFVAPNVDGDLTFSLLVHGVESDSFPATVMIHVTDQAPSAPTVILSPTSPKRVDVIRAQASAFDPDQDSLTYTYAWKRNGVLVTGATTEAYPLGNQVKGDVISVEVTATDGTLSNTGTAQIIIVDSPAALSGAAPTVATYGQAISFQVSASDADGDPTGPMEVEYGPAGLEVSSIGLVTWTPSGPMFDRTKAVNWAIRLKADITSRLSGTILVSDPARALPLTRSNLGSPRSGNCLDIQDFDGDGSRSILVGADTLYLLKKGGSSYDQTWVSPFDPGAGNPISALASGDANEDGRREIFFTAGTLLTALNGTDRRESAHFGDNLTSMGGPKYAITWTAVRCADIDGDGKLELVCLGSETSTNLNWLFVLDAATLVMKWNTSMMGLGSSLALANVDSDPALEIITSGGFVFDGVTQANEWTYGTGFGFAVDAGDLDGDGIAEIVGAVDWTAVRVYSALLKSPIWEIKTSDIDSIKVVDLDGLAPAEILVGDGQWGNVTMYRYDAATKGALKIGQINSQDHGVSALAAGDVDGDGTLELVWGTGLTSSGADFMCIASSDATPALKWKGPTPQFDGPFTGAKPAHLGPGQDGIVFVTARTSSGYAGQRVLVMDPATGALTVSSEVDNNWARVAACDVADVLGLGFDQVLLGTANYYDNYFTAFDVVTNAKRWSSVKLGAAVAITHGDLNKDGTEDLVGITTDGYVYAWDLAHQVTLWQSTGLGAGKDVAVADLDGDAIPEIVALTGTQIVIYLKSATTSGYLEAARRSITGQSLLIADTDGDGVPEIMVMDSITNSGATAVSRLDATLKTLNSFSVPKASSLFMEASTFPRKNLLVGLGDTGYVYGGNRSVIQAIDPRSGAKVWESPALAGTVSSKSLSTVHLGQDSTPRLTFGTSRAMYITQ